MKEYLILKLKGPMQSWGGHSYEDYRPTEKYPTRSGLIGVLGACLGIDRKDLENQQKLNESFIFAARADKKEVFTKKLVDFHTVEDVLKVDGSINPYPVVSRREYLQDAEFSVAISFLPSAKYDLEKVKAALSKPIFTPCLGRKSCPISRPLYETTLKADNLVSALSMIEPASGLIYSEEGSEELDKVMIVRDQPLFDGKRHFYNRKLYLIKQ